ncbi:MAG: Crp/Fnr family transcriptional regulator [Bacteroidota bacterium]
MEGLKKYLQQFYEVPDDILQPYLKLWRPYDISKKQLMRSEGEVELYLYFVLEGVQKSYYLHKDKEYVIAFAYAPSFSGIPDSFFTQTPSRYYLESITASHFLRISYEQHQQYLSAHREIETLYRKVAETFLHGVIQRQHEIMALSIEERFRAFAGRSAHLLQIIPQKDIASYLNISPTNFSKLINRIRI